MVNEENDAGMALLHSLGYRAQGDIVMVHQLSPRRAPHPPRTPSITTPARRRAAAYHAACEATRRG